MTSKKTKKFIHEPRRIDRTSDQHGEEHADGLPARDLLQNLMPLSGATPFLERIINEGLISSAGESFGEPTQDSVAKTEQEKNHPAIARGDAEQSHFQHHAAGSRHQKRFPSKAIRQHAGRNIGEEAGRGPGHIQKDILGGGKSKIKKQNRQHRIVKTAREEESEPEEKHPVFISCLIGSRWVGSGIGEHGLTVGKSKVRKVQRWKNPETHRGLSPDRPLLNFPTFYLPTTKKLFPHLERHLLAG